MQTRAARNEKNAQIYGQLGQIRRHLRRVARGSKAIRGLFDRYRAEKLALHTWVSV